MGRYNLLFIFSILLILTGCSDNNSDPAEELQIQLWNAVNHPQTEFLTLITSIQIFSGKTEQTTVTEVGYTIDGKCGGTSHIHGSYSSTGNNLSADIDIEFSDFCFSDIILKGHSDLIITELSYTDNNLLTYIGIYSGEADAEGDIKGQCSWDLTLNCSSGSLDVHGIFSIDNRDYNFEYSN